MSLSGKDEQYYRAVLEHNTVSRRGLFRGLFSGVNKAHQESNGNKVYRSAFRPPKTVDDTLLQRLCDHCGQCELACPESLISMVNGLPEVNLDYNSCTECGACQKVCPTLALSGKISMTGAYPTMTTSCMRKLGAECDDCVTACPHGALGLESASVKLRHEKCTGCGQCREACPSMAITMKLS